MNIPPPSTPIVCDMTNAPDTERQRLEEYRRLFTQALVGRERTATGVRFRFRAEPGTETWVRDLAAREEACCAFSAHDITTDGDEVVWDAAVTDNELARNILEEFYALPDRLDENLDTTRARFTQHGLDIIEDPRRSVSPTAATAAAQVPGADPL